MSVNERMAVLYNAGVGSITLLFINLNWHLMSQLSFDIITSLSVGIGSKANQRYIFKLWKILLPAFPCFQCDAKLS